jgi:hypothetical protein
VFTPLNASARALADEATRYWTSFARAHDPSAHAGAGAPRWPAADRGRLVIEEGGHVTRTHMEERGAAYEERCRFWNEVGAEILL